MREILFRGKRVDNGKWVEGNYIRQTLFYGEEVDRHWIMDIGEFDYDHYDSHLVRPETVGQYSGKEDRNGVKMFEGDIVAGAVFWQEQKINGIVAFRDGSYGLIWYRGNVEQFNPFTSMCNVEYEVIGNIHDNHELLKEGGE